MTEPVVETPVRTNREESVIEWLQRNARLLTISAVVVAVGGAGYWFYARSVQIRDQNAERALNTALQSVGAGNAALAVSDLNKVVDRYSNTQSGIEAGMLLAQMNYNAGKVQAGIAVLQKLLPSSAASMDMPDIYGLIGDGQMQSNKPADAAQSYQKAADAAKADDYKAYQLSKAARAFLAAHDTATATKIWEKLADDPKAQGVAAEARVRLGEVLAKPASKG